MMRIFYFLLTGICNSIEHQWRCSVAAGATKYCYWAFYSIKVCSLFSFLPFFFLCLETKKETKKIQGCRNRIRVRSRAHARQTLGGWLGA
jgi:hypothetical protein